MHRHSACTRRRAVGFMALITVMLTAPLVHADGVMFIQSGAFWMGRDDAGADEAPLHRVYVGAFWLERHKVTNAEFAEFLDARGATCTHSSSANEARPDRRAPEPCEGAPTVIQKIVDPVYGKHPVAVSWYGARDYCAWRGRRLPTEAEWEKAARGADGRRYPWGDATPTAAHAVFGRPYNATEPGEGRPAGASPYGVHDLIGNLREWTATMLKPYPYRHDDGREPFTGTGRVVVRGASHDDPVETLSVTRRLSYDRRRAAAGHHLVGFRCATSDDLGEVAPGGRR